MELHPVSMYKIRWRWVVSFYQRISWCVIPDSFIRFLSIESPQSCALWRTHTFHGCHSALLQRVPQPDHSFFRRIVRLVAKVFQGLGPNMFVKDLQKLGIYPGRNPNIYFGAFQLLIRIPTFSQSGWIIAGSSVCSRCPLDFLSLLLFPTRYFPHLSASTVLPTSIGPNLDQLSPYPSYAISAARDVLPASSIFLISATAANIFSSWRIIIAVGSSRSYLGRDIRFSRA